MPGARMGTIDFEAAVSSLPSAAQDHMPGSACSLRKDRQVATATVEMVGVDSICDRRCYKLEEWTYQWWEEERQPIACAGFEHEHAVSVHCHQREGTATTRLSTHTNKYSSRACSITCLCNVSSHPSEMWARAAGAYTSRRLVDGE